MGGFQAFQGVTQPWAVGSPLTASATELGQLAKDVILDAARFAPRSQQVRIGPSEIGTPCVSRLVRKLAGCEEVNIGSDPWASIVGTAVHSWLADAFIRENTKLGRERYKVEQKVTLPDGTSGTSDLFDRDTGRSIDWKVTSPDKIKEYQKKGPGETYQIQGHLYGLGQEMAGETVKEVCVVFLPRAGVLNPIFCWCDEYSRDIAMQALRRLRDITTLAHGIRDKGLIGSAQVWESLPRAESHCGFCPFYAYKSTDLRQACPGPDQPMVGAV